MSIAHTIKRYIYKCPVYLKPNSIRLAGSKLVRSWFEVGSKSWSPTSFEVRTCLRPARTSFEPASVMEFGFYFTYCRSTEVKQRRLVDGGARAAWTQLLTAVDVGSDVDKLGHCPPGLRQWPLNASCVTPARTNVRVTLPPTSRLPPIRPRSRPRWLYIVVYEYDLRSRDVKEYCKKQRR